MFAAMALAAAMASSPHHLEVMGSAGLIAPFEGDEYARTFSSGYLYGFGLFGSYRYSATDWLEIGASMSVHGLVSEQSKDAGVATAFAGSLRLRGSSENAAFLDVGGGALRLDESVAGVHAWATVPQGYLAVGGILDAGSTDVVVDLRLVGGGSGTAYKNDSARHPAVDGVFALCLEVGGRFDL